MSNPQDDQPRHHHYEFAHRALPSILLNPSVDLEQLAADPERLGGVLQATWEKVGSKYAESQRLPDDGLAVERREVGDAEGLLVTLPSALHVAEAFFVMVAPLNPPTARRLFTLESGWDVVNRKLYTVLGEWSKEGHSNLGDGPPAEVDAFVAAVSALMSR